MYQSIDSILSEANKLACRARDEEALAVLRQLPFEEFGRLLLEVPPQYGCLPAVLPGMPSDDVQRSWTGNSGRVLFTQSYETVRIISDGFERIAGRPLTGTTILDYGCGWGRLLRLMYAFTPPDRVFGTDPWDESLNICRGCGLLGHLALCDYLPRSLPFEGVDFDLIYAVSVFTNLSERAADLAQQAIRNRIKPDGLAVVTVRPVEYWDHHGPLPPGITIESLMATHRSGDLVFVPHNRNPIEGDITYGDTSIPIEYINRNWTRWKIESTATDPGVPHQITVFLKPV